MPISSEITATTTSSSTMVKPERRRDVWMTNLEGITGCSEEDPKA
jgi:hypothetical protein